MLDNSTGADVGVVLNVHVTVALGTGREGDEVADHTIVFDITVQVGVKVPPDTNVRSERNERAERSALTQRDIVHHHHVGGLDRPRLHTIGRAAVGKHLADCAVRNGNHDVS
ncbi:hypothetical protein D9M68_890290 [compost metagenome]